MEQYLYTKNFTKHYLDNIYYLKYIDNNLTIIYLSKNSFHIYFKKIYNLDITLQEKELLSEIIKVVNEVHGVALQEEDKLDLKNVNKRLIENKDLDRYSNKTALKTGSMNIELYNLELNCSDHTKFDIELSYCVNNYVYNKLNSYNLEYINIKQILNRLNINTFNGENQNYNNKNIQMLPEIIGKFNNIS